MNKLLITSLIAIAIPTIAVSTEQELTYEQVLQRKSDWKSEDVGIIESIKEKIDSIPEPYIFPDSEYVQGLFDFKKKSIDYKITTREKCLQDKAWAESEEMLTAAIVVGCVYSTKDGDTDIKKLTDQMAKTADVQHQRLKAAGYIK